MSEKQFDWFDKRFRDAAEQYEPPFDEASWNKLEGRLAAEKKPRRRFAWWWLSDAGIIALLLYLVFQLSSGANRSLPAANNADNQNPITTNTPDQGNVSPGITPNEARVSEKGASTITEQGRRSATDLVTGRDDQLSPTRNHAGYQPIVRQAPVQYISPGRSNNSAGKLVQQDAATILGNAKDDPPHTSAGTLLKSYDELAADSKMNEAQSDVLTSTGNSSLSAPQTDGKKEEQIKENSMAATRQPSSDPPAAPDAGKNATQKKLDSKSAGFYIYGMAGSEWSLVPGNDAGKASFAWGLGMGYRISPKWAVQAGYFQTRKLYDAGPGDYKPKPGTYYYNLTIKHVEADCQVTEIPIALSYTALQTKKHSLFATIGLSSFIMKSEDYHYDYIRANSTPGYARYQYSTNNSHLFAGLLLSGGYSYRLFDGFSLSAEPYFKIPLYGVGEGSIKIYSFGLMAGARYALPSFRKK